MLCACIFYTFKFILLLINLLLGLTLYWWMWFQELFKTNLSSAMPDFFRKVLWKNLFILAHSQIQTYTPLSGETLFCICVSVQCLLESGSPELRVWSSSVPYVNTSTMGTSVRATASGQLHCGSQGTPTLLFETVLCHLFWDKIFSAIW